MFLNKPEIVCRWPLPVIPYLKGPNIAVCVFITNYK